MKFTPGQTLFVWFLMLVSAVILIVIILKSPLDVEQPQVTQTYVGPLPADICLVDGAPQIYSGSSDLEGYTLVYLRNNGDVVVAKGFLNPMILAPVGVYWSGGTCPSE